ncbi:hypothetical protein KKE14_03250 [Patescibacteria group bacterium]|nr:hypothetical protein [Patescibacteria group bacterium]
MSKEDNNNSNNPDESIDMSDLSPQNSPDDTSSWENAPVEAPDGRVHIKTPNSLDKTSDNRSFS